MQNGNPDQTITVHTKKGTNETVSSGNKVTGADPVTYTITYHLNGGTLSGTGDGASSIGSYTEGQVYRLPTPTREGYTFQGWYTDERLSGTPVTEITSSDTGAKTFYASWTQNATDPDDGSDGGGDGSDGGGDGSGGSGGGSGGSGGGSGGSGYPYNGESGVIYGPGIDTDSAGSSGGPSSATTYSSSGETQTIYAYDPATAQGGTTASASGLYDPHWHWDGVGWRYWLGMSSYASSGWRACEWLGNTDWYYFDPRGYAVGGWFRDADGSLYYLHPVNDGHFGYMYTGWQEIDGRWYYFNTDTSSTEYKYGELLRSTVTPDGHLVDSTGARID